jgi:hypothetical protein
MVRLYSNLLIVFLTGFMSIFSCGRTIPFEVRAKYRSVANVERRYEVHTTGAYPAGGDITDTYQGRIVMKIGCHAQYELGVKAERFTPMVDQMDRIGDLEPNALQEIDSEFLGRFILATDPTASRDNIYEEAGELFAVLEAAGMGPKIGLPETKTLILLSSTYKYH